MTSNYIVVAYLLMAIITFAQYWLKTRSNDYWTLAMIAILWPITLVYARILRNRWARYCDFDHHAHVIDPVLYQQDAAVDACCDKRPYCPVDGAACDCCAGVLVEPCEDAYGELKHG